MEGGLVSQLPFVLQALLLTTRLAGSFTSTMMSERRIYGYVVGGIPQMVDDSTLQCRIAECDVIECSDRIALIFVACPSIRFDATVEQCVFS